MITVAALPICLTGSLILFKEVFMTTRIAFTGHRHLTTAEVFPGLDLLLKGYVFIFEVSQAYTEEVNTSTGKRRFDISSAHGFAA